AAAQGDGQDRFLGDRAFSAALLAGDIKKAAALAPTGPDADPAVLRLGALVRGVEALAEDNGKASLAILKSSDIGYPHRSAAILVTPWAAAAAGDVEGSIIHLQLPGDPIGQFFANLGQARLFERARRYDEAETHYKSLIASGDPGALATLNYGAMLERRKRATDAAAVYQAALARFPDNSDLQDGLARAKARKPAPAMPTIRQAAAESMIAPAATLMIQHQQDVALAYLRLALRLDPGRDEAWMLVGDVLSNNGDQQAARDAYSRLKPGTDRYITARNKLAWTYQNGADHDAALKVARETFAAAPASLEAAVNLADLLRADEQYEDSAKILDKVIASEADHPDWRLLYARAASLQEAGRWQDAERDLTLALKIRPDEPELLNFLAYSWIDRGERLNEALAMVKKAVDANPQSGAMLDSLGWAYYRLGDYKTAVAKLEDAVVLEPADPDVNDHLGDAYWRVGRKTEADYQWRRVLILAPSAKTKAAVDIKLKSGLDGSPAPAVVAGQ
ncbi:MAG TPA: tetratricopeptide repeat protein, partial [Caulobacteraceae bacterium]